MSERMLKVHPSGAPSLTRPLRQSPVVEMKQTSIRMMFKRVQEKCKQTWTNKTQGEGTIEQWTTEKQAELLSNLDNWTSTAFTTTFNKLAQTL